MGIIDDFVDAAEDVGEFFVDAAEEGFNAIVEGLEDFGEAALWAGNATIGAISDTAGAFGDVATSFSDTFGVGDAFDAVAGAAGDVFSAVIDPTLTALDDSGFFDVLEVATLTMVDVEYDSKTGLSIDYGLEDVFGFGIQIGEGGISGDVDAGGVGFEAGYGPNGANVGVTAGWDYGPLPSADAHVSVDEDGDLGLGGRFEGYLPTPAGMSGGEVGVNYQETDEGFRVDGAITARNYAPSGTYVGAGTHFGYEEDAQGYHTNVGLHVEAGQLGGPEVRASIDYNESRQGGVTTSGVSVSAEVSAPGVEVGGTVGYTHVETADGQEYDVVSGSAYASGAGLSGSGQASVTSGPDGLSLDGDVDVDVGDPAAAAAGIAQTTGIDLPAADMPDIPDIRDIPEMIGVPGVPDLPDLSDVPGLPDPASLPSLPSLDELDPTGIVRDQLTDGKLGEVLAEQLPDPAAVVPQVMEQVAEQLAEQLPDPAAVVPQVMEQVAEQLAEQLPDPAAVVPQVMEQVAEQLADDVLGDAAAAVPQIVDELADDGFADAVMGSPAPDAPTSVEPESEPEFDPVPLPEPEAEFDPVPVPEPEPEFEPIADLAVADAADAASDALESAFGGADDAIDGD